MTEHRVPAAPPEASSAELNPMMTLEFAKFANSHTTEYIRLADAKAGILITLLSANLLVLIQRGGEYIAEGHTAWRLALVLCASLYALASLAVAVNIIRPRLFRNASSGHLFWEDVASQDKERYASTLPALTTETMFRQLGEHHHNLARAALRKYRWLRVAFLMAVGSIAISASVILVTSG